MNCSVCYRLLGTEVKPVKLTCSCTSCIDCLTAWTIEQINALEFQSKQEVPCMEGFCKKPFKVEHILDQFPKSYQDRINDALLSVYLRRTQDIRKCPTDSCAYAGVIDLNSTCDDNLKCAICDTEWKEKALYTSSSQGFESKIKLLLDSDEISCLAWEEFFTKKCPRCNASIQKNGGCSHMTCKGCGMEFCWYCTQDNFNHDNKICWLNLSVKLVLFLYFIVQVVYLTGICEEMVDLGLRVFNGVLEAFFLDFFLYLLCIISPHDIIGRFYTPENKIRLLISLVIFCFFVMVVILLDAITSILRIFLFQAAVVGFGLVYVDCFGKWINYVY